MSSMTGVRPPGAHASPSELAMRIGVVAAEAAFATFARSVDVEDLEEGGELDLEGQIGRSEWPVFSLVLDTLAAAEPGDPRTLDERRADALRDLARICLAVKGVPVRTTSGV